MDGDEINDNSKNVNEPDDGQLKNVQHEKIQPEPLEHSPQKSHLQVPRWIKIILIIIAFIIIIKLLIMFFAFLFSKKTSLPAPVPVIVTSVQEIDFPVYISALGSVTPTDTVTVKTQINGQLLRVLYKEGQLVQAGELLAEIDPRPYEAQLIQLQGQLLRDQALLENARIDLARYEKLYSQDSVSEQTLATQQSLVKQYEGTVQLDLGQIAAVELNIFYTRITSPINGRVGLRLVDAGNFVQTTDTTGLFVLNAMQPITVIFPIPEDNLGKVVEQVSANEKLKVEAYDRTQNHLLSHGTLLTYDNQIDTSTGTIKLRAQFENQDNRLFPNQFVNAKLLVDTLKNANVIPLAAIQRGVQGTFVYLVKPDNKVEIRPVSIEVSNGEAAAVTGEIFPGEKVVIQGAEKLKNYSKVVVTEDTKNRHERFGGSNGGSGNSGNNDINENKKNNEQIQDKRKSNINSKNKSKINTIMNYASLKSNLVEQSR